jgi:hypothetical protein
MVEVCVNLDTAAVIFDREETEFCFEAAASVNDLQARKRAVLMIALRYGVGAAGVSKVELKGNIYRAEISYCPRTIGHVGIIAVVEIDKDTGNIVSATPTATAKANAALLHERHRAQIDAAWQAHLQGVTAP